MPAAVQPKRFAGIDVGLDDKDHIPSSEERFRVAMARQL
jgi:hypothetical protein